MKHKQHHAAKPTAAIPTLDLHGYRLQRALQEMVEFLAQQHQQATRTTMVHIITGMGEHSTEGPVLRGAVEKWLQRHDFLYKWHSRGVFTVQCSKSNKGRIPYRRQESDSDTKLIVVYPEQSILLRHGQRNGKHGGWGLLK